MPPLLQLPPEIRELIIEHFLQAPRLQWNDNALAAAAIDSGDEPRQPLPKLEQFHSNSTALLLVCKTLRDETIGVIRRKFSLPNYSLDVVALHEWEFRSTWTCVPVLSERCGTIHVGLRHHGTAFEKHMPNGGWMLNEFPPMPKLLSNFSSLFHDVVLYGPRGPVDRTAQLRKIVIEKLILDFVTPPEVVPAPYWKEVKDSYHSIYVPMIWRDDGMVDIEIVFSQISQLIGWQLDSTLLRGSMPVLLRERVGVLELHVDGTLRKQFELNKTP